MVCHGHLYLHPAIWNLDMMAGSQAATIDPYDKSYTLKMIERWMNLAGGVPKVRTDNPWTCF